MIDRMSLGTLFLSLGISTLAFPLNAQDQGRAPYGIRVERRYGLGRRGRDEQG